MYTRIFKFFNNNNLFYHLQFGFRQNYSTAHALISLTETIRKYLGEGKFACDIFVDLQKAFGTVEHDILLTKLKHYGVRGPANDWFKSYLSDRKQFVSTNAHDSYLAPILYDVPYGSVLGPLLFLIYIDDLNQAEFCKVHHFADDINLLHFSKSKLNKNVNLDMKNLKLVSAIFYQFFIFHQMIALQELWKMFFISSKKIFSFSKYSNFCIFIFLSFFPLL